MSSLNSRAEGGNPPKPSFFLSRWTKNKVEVLNFTNKVQPPKVKQCSLKCRCTQKRETLYDASEGIRVESWGDGSASQLGGTQHENLSQITGTHIEVRHYTPNDWGWAS